MQIHQHRLLELRLSVVHHDRVVVPVQAVDERLNRRLVDVPDVGCRLPWFLTKYDGVWVDEPECIDDDFSLDGLNWIDDDGDRPWVQLFE